MKKRYIRHLSACLWGIALIGLLAACGSVRRSARPSVTSQADRSIVRDTLSAEQQRKYDYFYLEAMRLKMQRKYDAAFDLLQHCLRISPHASSALYEVAQYYVALKQPERGEAILEQAVRHAPDNYWYSQGLVNLYLQQQETDKAIALLEDMTARFPDKLDPVYSLLDLYNRQEKYDDVLALLNQLEAKLGKSEQMSMEKFRIYVQQQDKANAFKEIESLVAEYPKDTRYQVLLGDVYLDNGKKEEAYGVYRDVLDAEPDNAAALYSLANYYEQTGQTERYERQLDTLLLNKKVEPEVKLDVMRRLIVRNEQTGKDSTRVITLFDRIMEQDTDDANMPMLYAQYLLSKGMNTQAWPVLERVIQIDPTNTAARMTLLGEAVRQEDYEDIIRLCEAGVESNPDMLEFYFYLAIAYNQAERTDEVIATCRKALTHLTPKSNKEVVSDFYAIMGDAYHLKAMDEAAYQAYDSALVYNPNNIGALNNYAYYLSLERKHLDKAEEMSYKTVKAEPQNATYLDTYAWILFEKGNYVQARLYIDQAMKSDEEKSAEVVEHCGDIYYMVGEVEEAVGYWKQALELGSESKTLRQKIEQRKYIREPDKTTTKDEHE